MKKYKKLVVATVIAGLFAGCTPTSYNNPNLNVPAGENTKTGALYGAIAGAIIGGITSGKSHRGKHILQGAVLGAGVGAAYGYSLDRQAAEMAHALNTNVDNSPNAALNPNKDIIVSKRANYVQITFRDKMMFETNSAYPTPSASEKIARVGSILKKYPQTIVQVVGHTDNRGSYEYNLNLSQQRARNVANMIKSSGIPNQVFAKGCSYNKSLVPNTTPQNMALNRRVEIYLYPNQQAVVDQCR
jgi:outer membrane protein OmpA-like peptidoglycan-associated protein